MILPDCTPADARDRAMVMKDGINLLRFTYAGQQLPHVAMSMGVSAYPAGGASPRDLLKAADLALYRAKQSGRNAVVVDEASAQGGPGTVRPSDVPAREP